MSTPQSPTESGMETPAAATNGDGRDTVPATESILTPPKKSPQAATTPWWKRLLGRG